MTPTTTVHDALAPHVARAGDAGDVSTLTGFADLARAATAVARALQGDP